MTLTTTVTWADLRASIKRQLEDVEESYAELDEQATDEYGDNWFHLPVESDTDDEDDESDRDEVLAAYQQQAHKYDESAKSLQSQLNLIGRLSDELGDEAWEFKMLSGQESMDIATEMRGLIKMDDYSQADVMERRNSAVIDAATVDAPEGVPRETRTDDGGEEYETPVPSECGNSLGVLLFEAIQRFNSAGDPDFRPEGVGLGSPSRMQTSGMSGPPTPSTDS